MRIHPKPQKCILSAHIPLIGKLMNYFIGFNQNNFKAPLKLGGFDASKRLFYPNSARQCKIVTQISTRHDWIPFTLRRQLTILYCPVLRCINRLQLTEN